MPPRVRSRRKTLSASTDWRQAILGQLRDGKVLPVVSNRLHNDLVLDGHDQLICDYAADSPDENQDIPSAAQYYTVMSEVEGSADFIKGEYLDFVKELLLYLIDKKDDGTLAGLLEEEEAQKREHDFSTMTANLGCPDLSGTPESNPLLALADFDLPVYLTTSYHCFLEQALLKAGKKPRTMNCCWHPRINPPDNDPFIDNYQPTSLEPLVYHLYGIDSCPESLVLSEDDYFSFMVTAERDRGTKNDVIHPAIRRALNDSSLMLLGYDLASWEFRTLLYGLIKSRSHRLQSVCALQLHRSEQEQEYLKNYMKEVAFKVFWGDTGEYLGQLHSVLQGEIHG